MGKARTHPADGLTDSEASADFDSLYAQHRATLYRALVLATGDRDLAVEAVDAGFAGYARRFRHGAADDAVVEVLRSAGRHITRRERRRQFGGFRLPEGSPSESTAAIVGAMRRLDLTERLVLVCSVYLGWSDEAIAKGLGLFAGDVAYRRKAAMARVLAASGSDGTGDGRRSATAEVLTASGSDGTAVVRRAAAAEVLAEAGANYEGSVAGAFDEAAAGMAVPLSRLESVKSRARMRRVGVVVGLAAAVMAVGGAGVGAARSLLDDAPVANEIPADAEGPVATGTWFDEVEWVRGELPFREGDLTAVTAGPEGFTGIGMDWSAANAVPRALTSPDGVSWSINGTLGAIGNGGGWISGLVYNDERYLAVGSRVDGAMGRETPTLFISEDAAVWAHVDLPVGSSVEIEDFQINVYTSAHGVVASGDTITVFGMQHGDADLEQVLRDELPDGVSMNSGWGFSDAGLEIYDSQGEVVFRTTAEELEIPAEVWQLMGSGKPVVWRSSDDGATWESADFGNGPGAGGWLSYVTANDAATIAVVGGQFGGELWRADGESWERVELGRGVVANGVAEHDGDLYAAGFDETGRGAVWRSTDGVEWDVIDSEAFADLSLERLVGSAYGLVAVGSATSGDPIGPAIVHEGDLEVAIAANGLFTVTGADGEILVEIYDEEVVRSGSSVEIVDPESGESVVTIDQRAIDLAWEEVYSSLEGRHVPGGPLEQGIAVSRDGDTWVRLETTDVFPTGFYPNAVVLGPTSLLVVGWSEGGGVLGAEPGIQAYAAMPSAG